MDFDSIKNLNEYKQLNQQLQLNDSNVNELKQYYHNFLQKYKLTIINNEIVKKKIFILDFS